MWIAFTIIKKDETLTNESQLHPEAVPSVQTCYANEVRRVLQVVERHLEITQRHYLFGDKIRFADFMFVL